MTITDGLRRPHDCGPSEIVARIAADHCLAVPDLVGRSRRSDLVEARREAIVEVWRSCPGLTLAEIGSLVGRDRSTVSHHIARHLLRVA